jgi:hypothetical protein
VLEGVNLVAVRLLFASVLAFQWALYNILLEQQEARVTRGKEHGYWLLRFHLAPVDY